MKVRIILYLHDEECKAGNLQAEIQVEHFHWKFSKAHF